MWIRVIMIIAIFGVALVPYVMSYQAGQTMPPSFALAGAVWLVWTVWQDEPPRMLEDTDAKLWRALRGDRAGACCGRMTQLRPI